MVNTIMRLQELLNEYYDLNPVSDIAFLPIDDPDEELGSGYFSHVNAIKDNPHDVTKTSYYGPSDEEDFDSYERNQGEDADGYVVFLRALANDRHMQDNIHFPQVRKVAIDENDRIHAEIEKLETLESLSLREIYTMFQRYYPDDPSLESFRQNLRASRKRNRRGRSRLRRLPDQLSSRIAVDAMDKQGRSKSYELNTAIRWIGVLGQQERFNIDIHSNNLMARRTPYGIIPVINDPLGMARSDWPGWN